MDHAPDPLGQSAREPQPAKIGDRRLPADRRKTTRMAITEGSRRRPAGLKWPTPDGSSGQCYLSRGAEGNSGMECARGTDTRGLRRGGEDILG